MPFGYLDVVRGLLRPVYEFLLDGGARYYWVYCVTGLLIAAYAHAKSRQPEPFHELLLSRDVWLGKSARNDYYVLVIGSLLRLTLLSWAFLNWEPISEWVVATLRGLGVTGTQNDAPVIGLAALLTLTVFVVDDFLRWWAHYLMHRIPELWEFHKVHHSAEQLNFATAERFHPVETVLSSLICTLGFGLTNGLFIALFGNQLTPETVFGANAFLVAFNIAGGVLRHSPFWVSFGPSVERWIISPAMHQIHHSSAERHFDKNLGGSLAIWDRLWGTLHIPNGREIEAFGIGAETADFRSLSVIYFRPFARGWLAFKARGRALAQLTRLRNSGYPTRVSQSE